jgi:hypothetical protein
LGNSEVNAAVEPIRRLLLEPLQGASSSVPLPWRVALTVGPVLLLALLLLPRLLRVTMEALSRVVEWLGGGYAWIEYQIVRPIRRFGHQPWWLVYVLDGGIEALIVRLVPRMRAIARSSLLRRAIRTTVVAAAAIPLLCWYLAPKVEPRSELRTTLRQGIVWTTSFDAWVRTGTWPQPRDKASAKKPSQKVKPKSKRHQAP